MWSRGRKLWVSQICCLSGSTTFKAVKPNQRKLCELFFRKQNSSERGHVQTVGNILLFSWVCIFCILQIIDEYVCLCVYKKKIIGFRQIKMLCSPWNRRFFDFAVNSSKIKAERAGCRRRQGCLGSQLWCAGVCLGGLLCRHCPAGYFIQCLLQQDICQSELKQCLQIDSCN